MATIVIDVQLEPKLMTALAASAAAIGVMVFTLVKVWARAGRQAGDLEDSSQSEPDVKSSLLRVSAVILLAFFSVGLIVLGIAGWVGKASVADIWQMLEKAALAEALVLAYSGIANRR